MLPNKLTSPAFGLDGVQSDSVSDRISIIRDRLAKATPGPWYPGHLSDDNHPCNCNSVSCESYAGTVCYIEPDNGKSVSDGGNDGAPPEEAKANLLLIANAPSDLAFLLEQVESKQPTVTTVVALADALRDARQSLINHFYDADRPLIKKIDAALSEYNARQSEQSERPSPSDLVKRLKQQADDLGNCDQLPRAHRDTQYEIDATVPILREAANRIEELEGSLLELTQEYMARSNKTASHIEDMETILRELQWSGGYDGFERPLCPFCQRYKTQGHTGDCLLEAALTAGSAVER